MTDQTLKDIDRAFKALEERDELLDKIRTEIEEQYDRVHPYNISCAEGLEMALGIIDKYKTECEDKRMNEEEKERLIKKDIASIENRVRHAFNQGYEMGLKDRKNICKDAISRQAVLDATVKRNSIWNKITNSKGENLEEIISQLPPVTPQEPCDVPDINVGDMISRKAVLEVIRKCHCEEWIKADIGAPIEALSPVNSQEPMREFTEEEAKSYSKALDKMYKPTGFNVFNELCEDAISRAEAIKAMNDLEQEDIERYGCHIPEGFDGERAIEVLQSLPSVIPQYTEDEIQKMQDLEQAEIEKAYEFGKAEGQKSEVDNADSD